MLWHILALDVVKDDLGGLALSVSQVQVPVAADARKAPVATKKMSIGLPLPRKSTLGHSGTLNSTVDPHDVGDHRHSKPKRLARAPHRSSGCICSEKPGLTTAAKKGSGAVLWCAVPHTLQGRHKVRKSQRRKQSALVAVGVR